MSREDRNGWVYVSVRGEPFARGKAYGSLIRDDMRRVKTLVEFVVMNDLGVEWAFFVTACRKHFTPTIRATYPEFYDEMRGVAEGCGWTTDEVVAWNNYFTLTENWWAHMPEEESIAVRGTSVLNTGASREGGSSLRGTGDRCSAIVANGSWTKTGEIVMAHNNFSNFVDGQLAKYVVHLAPTNGGNAILMVGFPGWIWSGTDFFVTTAGIMGCETTMGGFVAYEMNLPISCRIRQAMQYGNTLDDYTRILIEGNSGDYANSWLFGDTNTNEILRLELGLRFHNIERTMDGYFIGFNAPYDPRIRHLECVNTGFDDVRRHQGARRVRLNDLMVAAKGALTADKAQGIIADHYDVYLEKENPCSRTCCSHYELDPREYMSDPSRPKPFQPRGALDGNVCDSAMAKRMTMRLRWGTSCGIPFDKDAFCDKHRQWDYLREYLEDRPTQPWTDFSAKAQGTAKTKTEKKKTKKHTRPKKKTRTSTKKKKKKKKDVPVP
jgi:hypothetical protein